MAAGGSHDGGGPTHDDEAASDARASIESLLAEHLPRLRAFVRLKAGPVVRAREAESDIVQSTCREILTHRERYLHPGEENFRRWLFSTALRKILDKRDFHTAARRDVRRAADGDLLSVYAGLATPSQVASAREQIERIEDALARLPDDQREVVVLSRIAGFSRAEIAAEMQRSEASVRNLLHRALMRLSRELQRD